MTIAKVRAALESRLGSMSPALSTAYENMSFTPVAGTAYQRVFLLPAAPENPTMGDGYYREIGLLQVSLFYPQNVGAGVAQARAEAIKAHFPRGGRYTSGGVTTTILRTPEIGPGRIDGDRFVLDVSIRYHADIFP